MNSEEQMKPKNLKHKEPYKLLIKCLLQSEIKKNGIYSKKKQKIVIK